MSGEIQYGNIDITDELEGSGKTRITAWIDHDVKQELKKRAGAGGYQTLMNTLLREILFGEKGDGVTQRLSKLEKEVARIKKSKGA